MGLAETWVRRDGGHVLMAMGMPVDEASECVRFSFGWDTAAGDGQRAADAVVEVVEAMA